LFICLKINKTSVKTFTKKEIQANKRYARVAQLSLRRRTLDHGPADIVTSESIKLNDAPQLRFATNYALIHNCYTKYTVSTQWSDRRSHSQLKFSSCPKISRFKSVHLE
jgi:hypothetical protein